MGIYVKVRLCCDICGEEDDGLVTVTIDQHTGEGNFDLTEARSETLFVKSDGDVQCKDYVKCLTR